MSVLLTWGYNKINILVIYHGIGSVSGWFYCIMRMIGKEECLSEYLLMWQSEKNVNERFVLKYDSSINLNWELSWK